MKKLVILIVLCLSISVSCRSNKRNPSIKDAGVNQVNDTTRANMTNANFNPPFYLWIDEVHWGTSWYDQALQQDMVFRIVSYKIEEDVRTVIEKISIVGESELKLIRQVKLNGEILHMPNEPMPKLKFIEWINSKEAKFQIDNDSCKILSLETLSLKQCK